MRTFMLYGIAALSLDASPGHGRPPIDPPAPYLFLAAQPGKPTLDQGEGGGNPFASAFVQLLADSGLTLGRLPRALSDSTLRKSDGFQKPDVPAQVEPANWRFATKATGEVRVALVLVYSNYAASEGAASLPGARTDAERVGAALSKAGFEVEVDIDPVRTNVPEILQRFSSRSAHADLALIYTTGHGLEVAGTTYLLPGDYPVSQGNRALAARALKVSDIAASAHGNSVSLVFYAGCRDDPFGRP